MAPTTQIPHLVTQTRRVSDFDRFRPFGLFDLSSAEEKDFFGAPGLLRGAMGMLRRSLRPKRAGGSCFGGAGGMMRACGTEMPLNQPPIPWRSLWPRMTWKIVTMHCMHELDSSASLPRPKNDTLEASNTHMTGDTPRLAKVAFRHELKVAQLHVIPTLEKETYSRTPSSLPPTSLV